jgi:hypothetical protein
MGHDYKDPKVEEAFDYILDTFSGADGCGTFAKFMFFIRDIDERAANGDEASKKLLGVMFAFYRLIKVVNK